MIIKGKSRAGPAGLAAHLRNTEKNERVSLLETRGTIAQDLRGALIEMDTYAMGTRCEKSLYHAAISPEPPHRLTPEQRAEAIEALEDKLGLTGHARVVVMHEKLGREHIHVVWSRIDLDRMVSVSDSHNYRKHEEVARDLERRFGHDRVQGAHHERDGVQRPERTPSRAELRQEERSGIKSSDVRAEVTAAFRASDNAEAFKSALEQAGYVLAKGDRRDFVILDRAGGIHSLARRIEVVKTAELRTFMSSIDREKLPGIPEAREIATREARKRREAHDEARLGTSYARGDDYVSQTQAALKDNERRQDKLDNRGPRPKRPAGRPDDEERIAGILDDHDRDRRRNDERPSSSKGHAASAAFANIEMTEAQQQRMERMLGDAGEERDHSLEKPPDKQREAPGGGRTRSR